MKASTRLTEVRTSIREAAATDIETEFVLSAMSA